MSLLSDYAALVSGLPGSSLPVEVFPGVVFFPSEHDGRYRWPAVGIARLPGLYLVFWPSGSVRVYLSLRAAAGRAALAAP